MDILKNLKLDTWWNILIWCGVALFALGAIFEIPEVSDKSVMGLGGGLFITGFAYLKSLKKVFIPYNNFPIYGYFEKYVSAPKLWNKILLFIGWIIIIYFGAVILWELIRNEPMNITQ